MRLIILSIFCLLSFTISAQSCAEGEGLLTIQTVEEATCLEYRTTLTLENDQRYIVLISVATDSVTVARAYGRQFLGKQSWPRTSEGITQAVYLYNGHLTQISKR
jgi:hypothetical protein